MPTLIIAQTIFYFSVSLVIIIFGITVVLVGYRFIKLIRELHNTIHNIHSASSEALERVRDVLEKLSALPFLALFLKKRRDSSRR